MLFRSAEHFTASLSKLVKGISVIVCVILLGLAVGSCFFPPQVPPFARWIARVVPLLILLGTLPFLVRGYTLTEHELVIHRLGWSNRFALVEIISAEADPEMFRNALRVCGSGGLFGFSAGFGRSRSASSARIARTSAAASSFGCATASSWFRQTSRSGFSPRCARVGEVRAARRVSSSFSPAPLRWGEQS